MAAEAAAPLIQFHRESRNRLHISFLYLCSFVLFTCSALSSTLRFYSCLNKKLIMYLIVIAIYLKSEWELKAQLNKNRAQKHKYRMRIADKTEALHSLWQCKYPRKIVLIEWTHFSAFFKEFQNYSCIQFCDGSIEIARCQGSAYTGTGIQPNWRCAPICGFVWLLVWYDVASKPLNYTYRILLKKKRRKHTG